MPVLRDRFNWRGFTNLFARNRATGYLLGVGLVVVVAVAVLGSLWAALSVSEDNAAAKENEAWIREFSSSEDSELSGETRKILAAGLLDWDGQGVDVDLTEEQAEAFAVTAEEGTTPELDTTRGSWDYWGLGLRIWLP